MQIYIFVLAIFLSSHSLTAFAESSILIKNVKSCFSGSFETHEKWGNLLESKKKNFNKELFKKHLQNNGLTQLKQNYFATTLGMKSMDILLKVII